jgi:predicted secreted protein
LKQLEEQELVEASGKTSGTYYLLHVSKRKTIEEKVDYVLQKKQVKARQKEAILRYIDEIGKINNPEARALLKLADKDSALVSKLFKSLQDSGDIIKIEQKGNNCTYYGRKR